jgi:hypothetical protein
VQAATNLEIPGMSWIVAQKRRFFDSASRVVHPRSDRPNGTLGYVLPLLCLERSTSRKKFASKFCDLKVSTKPLNKIQFLKHKLKKIHSVMKFAISTGGRKMRQIKFTENCFLQIAFNFFLYTPFAPPLRISCDPQGGAPHILGTTGLHHSLYTCFPLNVRYATIKGQ